MQSANSGINIAVVLFTQLLSDRVGRKPLMLAGAVVQLGALMTMGGLGTVSDPSLAIMSGITAMVTVFGVGFQLGWAPLSHVVAAEIPTTRLRDATYAFGAIFNIAIQFAVSFSIPYLLYAPYANLGSKVVSSRIKSAYDKALADHDVRDSSSVRQHSCASSSPTSAFPSAAVKHLKRLTSSSSKAYRFEISARLRLVCLSTILERETGWRRACISRKRLSEAACAEVVVGI